MGKAGRVHDGHDADPGYAVNTNQSSGRPLNRHPSLLEMRSSIHVDPVLRLTYTLMIIRDEVVKHDRYQA